MQQTNNANNVPQIHVPGEKWRRLRLLAAVRGSSISDTASEKGENAAWTLERIVRMCRKNDPSQARLMI